jgi:hypothetical protein
METSNIKNTHDRFNYQKNIEHIALIRKNYYEKKKDDPEYKKKHSDNMKKYYQKRKLLKIEEDKLINKQIEESNEYIIQRILLRI